MAGKASNLLLKWTRYIQMKTIMEKNKFDSEWWRRRAATAAATQNTRYRWLSSVCVCLCGTACATIPNFAVRWWGVQMHAARIEVVGLGCDGIFCMSCVGHKEKSRNSAVLLHFIHFIIICTAFRCVYSVHTLYSAAAATASQCNWSLWMFVAQRNRIISDRLRAHIPHRYTSAFCLLRFSLFVDL